METINKKRWGAFCEAMRRHWPNLTDSELLATDGRFDKLEELVESKSKDSSTQIRETLAMIFDEVDQGNPQTIDDFGGIERAQSDPPTPPSNEVEAREDQNYPNSGF